MLNALFAAIDGCSDAALARASASMTHQGFIPGPTLKWTGGLVQTWCHPAQVGVDDCLIQLPNASACCVGPLWYRGQFGRAALEHIVADIDATGRLDESVLRGNFAIFLSTAQHCLLMNDLLGFVRVYISGDSHFYGTSWLAACAYANHPDVAEAAAIEYVLTGAAHSDQTVAQGIATLPLAHAADLANNRLYARPTPWTAEAAPRPATPGEAAEALCAHLHTVSTEVAAAFPRTIRMALSGGFDSRLILAGLLGASARPDLFVFGGEASTDVSIARTVAADVDLPLTVIDKQALDADRPLPDLKQLASSALFFDGLPNDGICDRGADQATRLSQNANGFLALNGGGGEIFRNYFHLPNRPFTAMELVHTFYRGFDTRVFRRAQVLRDYEERMAASIQKTVGSKPDDGALLSRDQVELAYPLFRCHHWMAVNNSVATRHGYYTTPLIDPITIRLAWRLPLAWKNAGAFESRLIATMHPGIASLPSAHGFAFMKGPNLHARLGAWATRLRPVSARPLINGVHRQLHGLRVSHSIYAHYRELLPGDWRLDGSLDLARLQDRQAFARALSIETALRTRC